MKLMTLVKIVLVIAMGSLIYSVINQFKTTVKIFDYSMDVIPVIGKVSQDWSIPSIEENFSKEVVQNNLEQYLTMIEKGKELGALESCDNPKLLEGESIGVEEHFFLYLTCEFTNGKSNLVVFMTHDGDALELLGFMFQ